MSTFSTQSPRSSTELFPDTMKLSPKQREVLSVLQKFPQGARAAEVAKKMGMHVNTARGHLDELVNAGAVRVVTAPAQGRGRPSLIFQVRVPDNRSVAEEYVTLISVLIKALAAKEQLNDYASEQARELGREWAKTAASSHGAEALGSLHRMMREMGFDPVTSAEQFDQEGRTDVELHACPFVTAGVEPSPFVCAIHDGYLEQAAADSGGRLSLKLIPKSGNGVCRISVEKPS
ncbi:MULTISPECIES: metalloregulator ArsR/SmtB family transcription factor [Corynebacterium]|uniref:helix-turn-helix transcriptional regulator n=1 Tax=Corynebacterium TaxID=1716 RepID=UPI000665EB75|nr:MULTISPECIES: ArsR family transcriptional regulator [Corynebacterium]OFK64441.1 ArsR family transcriptional regulator [Corynebacterium sp. HMSC076G08]OFN76049.1 ArsR family transcriptional regulator [Corynebacterium sp. HMSC070E08]OFO95309.1 ArsR family transcriptional regulator [Corynebacterium sp. HMSC034H07]